MTEIKRQGKYAIAKNAVGVYLFEIAAGDKIASPGILPFYNQTRQLEPVRIQDFEIVPYGQENQYPDELRQLLDENNLTPEILNKQIQLLWGQGPAMYRVIYEGGKRKKFWEEDPEIKAWLKTWDYEGYLLKATSEYRHLNGHFTKYYRNKAPRIGGKAMIASLESVSSVKARLEWPKNNIIKNIIVGDFSQPWSTGLASYPLFSVYEPFRNPVSMNFSCFNSFGLDLEYPRSPIHGTLNWIRLASSISKLLINYNLNSAAIKWHITSPQAYWSAKEQQLRDNCHLKNIEYTDKMLEDFIDATLVKFTETLSGVDKVGKFVHTQELWDDNGGKYTGWKIEPLDQKVKDYIDAQINVSKRAALETTSGLGLHPALSNISTDGNLPSGSEQLYAFKLYLLTGVDIPETIVCRDLNNAIAANWPEKDIKIGFYHDVVLTEESTNPSDRIKNN